MPRGLCKWRAVFTILKQRRFPHSSLLQEGGIAGLGGGGLRGIGGLAGIGGLGGFAGGMQYVLRPPRRPPVDVLETGVVGSLDYKIIAAERADDLYAWLETQKYNFGVEKPALDSYVKKNWVFT